MSQLRVDKLLALRGLLAEFNSRREAPLKEFQQFIDHLNFACKVVVPSRAFVRCLCDITVGLHRPHHGARMTGAVKTDLEVWESFNGISFWREDLKIKVKH